MRTAILCLALCAAALAQAAPTVWTVVDTRRVLRDDGPEGAASVVIAAARNEWESFQILVRSEEVVRGVTVIPSDLAGPGGARIPAGEARLYRQHQMEISVPTWRNEDFRPGWYPDALIPFDHPLTREPLGEARLRAVPFDLPADETHGFWVDVFVPRGVPAGEYRGAYRVEYAGGAVEVPVRLTVWGFDLPRVSAMRTAFGWAPDRWRGLLRQRAQEGKEVPDLDWSQVEEQCAEMFSRHRINSVPPAELRRPRPAEDGTYSFAPEQVEGLRRFIEAYHVNAFPSDHPRIVVNDPEEEKGKLHAWLKAWDQLQAELGVENLTFYTYLKDEPNDEEAYVYVRQWGKPIREAGSALKVLVVEQTWTQNEAWGDLHGAVDIWCPLFSLFRAESAAQRLALGEEVWAYTALCQREPTPWWHIDYPLLNYRCPSWIAWRYGQTGLLYWGGIAFWRQVEDPWSEPATLDRSARREGLVFNGEGSMLYPGVDAGYEGFAPSLRLKALRDSIEDYEYMAILDRMGLGEKAREVVEPLARSWFDWERDPAAYGAARAALARLIVEAREGAE